MCGRRADIHYFMRWEKKRFNAYMRDIRLTLNISSHLLNARQAEKINRFKKSSSQLVKGISSTYALKSWRQKLVFGVCKKCHFLELFLCSQDIYLWCYCDVVTGQFCLNFFSLRIILALSPDCCWVFFAWHISDPLSAHGRSLT